MWNVLFKRLNYSGIDHILLLKPNVKIIFIVL